MSLKVRDFECKWCLEITEEFVEDDELEMQLCSCGMPKHLIMAPVRGCYVKGTELADNRNRVRNLKKGPK